MNVTLTENSGVDGAVDIMGLLELLTQCSILHAFALPNHRDFKDLDLRLMKPLHQKNINCQFLRGRG